MDLSSMWNSLPLPGRGRTRARTVLEIDLQRGVLTSPPDNPLAALRSINAASLQALAEGLREAAKDDRVAGLLLRVGEHSHLDLAGLQELGLLVREFGEKKPTVAFAETFGEFGNAVATYTLATQADQVWLQPTGQVGLSGVHVTATLLRGLLEKGGLEPQFGQRKEYKSAADQFAAREVTPAHREMLQRLADSVLETCVQTIAERRGKAVEQVRTLVDRAMLSADEALAEGLVDRIGYRDEVYDAVLGEWGAETDDLKFVHRYAAGATSKRRLRELANRGAPAVGVVTLRGAIVTGRGRPGAGPNGHEAGSDVVAEQLRAARRDDRVKAVLLRIDSPGGSAVASDVIWREVGRVRESGRPVIAQMGSVAASGGYYAAMGADEIVALPGTLTGSIGVLAGKFVARGTYDLLGLVREGIDAGRHAGMLSADRRFTDEEWALLDRWLDAVYADFTRKAAQGRGMDLTELEPLARGRVWTGADAQRHGLVDHLGGAETALRRACERAGLQREGVVLKQLGQPGLLGRFQPAASSESPTGGVTAAGWAGPLTPEGLLQRVLGLAGLPTGLGVLSLPWRVELH